MSRVITLAALLTKRTAAYYYKVGLGIATRIGLPVTSWQVGDPTRVQFNVESEYFEALDAVASGYVGSGFLDFAEGIWRYVTAKQGFNVDVPEATTATTDVVLTNPSFFAYDDIAPNDLTFKNSITGKTYHNTTGGNLPAKVGVTSGTLTVTVVADEAGSDSSAGAGEIDELVTTLGDTTCTNPVAAIAVDEQDWEVTKIQCREKQDSWSANGPKGAYSVVARDRKKSSTAAVTRVRVYGDSDVGEVTVYLAGPSGAVSETDRALVETGILKWATPLCVTPIVLACTNVVVPITYSLWVYKKVNKTAAEIAEAVEKALEQMFASRDIGGDIIPPATTGKLYVSLIESTIRNVFPEAFRVVVALPAADVALTNGQVAALGTVTPTITIVVNP